jgi:hypothetical protein
MKGTSPADMAVAPPKCAAAAGLAGINLACVDFSTIPDQTLTSPPPQALTGWSFGKDSMNRDCWEIKAGKLEVLSFSRFADTCSFKMPALSAADYQKYNSFTLSVVQSVNLDATMQKAEVLMGLADPLARLVDWTTGKQPRQQRVYAIDKAALPNGGSGAYQPLFQIISGCTSCAQGWQIESIAINGLP